MGVDVSPGAIEQARGKAAARDVTPDSRSLAR
jgi:hypothetical protein